MNNNDNNNNINVNKNDENDKKNNVNKNDENDKKNNVNNNDENNKKDNVNKNENYNKFIEKRKYPRLPIELRLDVNEIYKQDYKFIKDLDAKIDVINISKSGIGFMSKADLPLEYYFDSTILLYEDDFFIAVIKIIRKFEMEDGRFNYGAEFTGLAPFLAEKIKKYGENLVKNNKNN